MTILEALRRAVRRATEASSDATEWEARLLLADCLGERGPLHLDPRRTIPDEARERFEELFDERLAGRPVQYLLGEWDFFGRTFFVDDRALIPRPETEGLAEEALRAARSARLILDLGTGSGNLAVTLLAEMPRARAVGVDCSTAALALAAKNARRHAVDTRLKLVASDWLTPFRGRPLFDLAVANPPYVGRADAEKLSPTVRTHEPSRALFAGEDGLSEIDRLCRELPPYLPPGAVFLFEFGFGQEVAVRSRLERSPEWRLERIAADHNGIPRVAVLLRRVGPA
jgi:release factor glutamine methyltransferase